MTRTQWARRIKETWLNAANGMIESILKMGRDLIAAKESLEHGEFIAMIESDLPFSDRWARKLMAVARDQRLSKRKYTSVLPPSTETLYALTQLDDKTFIKLINNGTINQTMGQNEARSYWYKDKRKQTHKDIADKARAVRVDKVGPYPLIYADPPWKFATYSEKGLEKTPDQHYPTLTDAQIADFKVNGLFVRELAMKSAALLLWCTSSNIHRALAIMEAWDFEYKSQAVWVKTKSNGKIWTGTGLVFRNAHEVLLYGTRGSMPGPQYQPPSVMMYPRGRHSEKPAGIRREIEKMYPDFGKDERAELFARDQFDGWTCYGFEALKAAA